MNITQLLDNADLMVAARQYECALATYHQIIEEKKDCDEAYLLRGELYGKLGQIEKAFDDVLKAISIDPNYDEAYRVLASLHLAQNNPEKAIEAYQKAAALNNKDAVNQLVQLAEKLADQQLAMHQPYQALDNYNRAIKYAADNTNLLYKRAFTVSKTGEFKQAMKLTQEILKDAPEHIPAKSLLVAIYEKTGQHKNGWSLIKSLVEAHTENVHLNIIFGKYALQNDKQMEAIGKLSNTLQQTDLKIDDQLSIHMLLGKLYDSISAYSDAFTHFSKANNLKFKDYDIATFENQVSGYVECFSKENYNKLASSSNKSNAPIFILGMPRSGTSLVEQIISSHSQVHGSGELQVIPEIVRSMIKADSGAVLQINLDSVALTSYSEELLQKMQILSPGSPRITDKLPHNFLYIGLIQKLLPNAKIINCLRNPIDNCLSCYFQHFGGYHPYAYNLTNLGKYYMQYERLMKHWEYGLGIPVLNVQYENMIDNTKVEVERILKYLNLEWEDNCLAFYKQKRSINTASYTQVNKNIYNNSVGRWRNYESHISELTTLLKRFD